MVTKEEGRMGSIGGWESCITDTKTVNKGQTAIQESR